MAGIFPEKFISSCIRQKCFFQRRFSFTDHLNVMNTDINTYFNYIVAKTRG